MDQKNPQPPTIKDLPAQTLLEPSSPSSTTTAETPVRKEAEETVSAVLANALRELKQSQDEKRG